jgi:thiamine-monophosphate kinase
MKLSQIGEFGLIDRLREQLLPRGSQVIIGIGDDAAAVRTTAGNLILLTADVLVERIHFDRGIHDFRQIGWRAMAANISDIAAMGGLPRHALVSICLPGDVSVEDVEEIYRGMGALAREYDCDIVGGDTVSAPRDLVISIAMTGEVQEERLVTRKGAQVGDLICVTGQLGGSQAGLAMLRYQLEAPQPDDPESAGHWNKVRERHLWPRPRLHAAQELVWTGWIHSMIDVSDGLAGDLAHIAKQSGVGAEIEEDSVPIDPQTRWVADHLNRSALDFALAGGEDFELLFTVAADTAPKVSEVTAKKGGLDVTVIGRVRPSEMGVVLVNSDGRERPLVEEGFQHFSRG